ncbi:MAG TPA: tetratricopeptide repeat protein [Anaeromyxobacteraceae bacterium]
MRTVALALAPLLQACLFAPAAHPRAHDEVRRGYRHLDAGDLERAEAAFALALEFKPDLPEAWNGAGVAAERRGDLAGARRLFERAVRYHPDFAEAHANLGAVALLAGDHASAEGHLRAALAVDPDLWVARLGLGRTLLHRGRAEPASRQAHWSRARREYLLLLESREDCPEAWHDLGYMDLESGRLEGAEASYRRAAALSADPASLHGLCASLARQGRCREAADACRRCLELAPGSAECRRSLGAAEGCR